MAINLFNKYGSRANPPSLDYPEGSIKNRSAPDVKDGTPLDADWANDQQGFFQSLISSAGVVANGLVDKVGDSQYFDALKSIISGNKASTAELQAGTNDSKFATPLGLKASGFWPLGFGQTSVDITSTFTKNMVYTNTEGRTIAIALSTVDAGAGVNELYIDGKKWGEQNTSAATSTSGQMFGIIQNGKTYEWRGGAAQSLVSCILLK